MVVETEQAERDREEVEEGVVAGEGDDGHEARENQAGVVPERAWGEEEERHDELDREHAGAGRAMPPGGQLMRIPAEDRRQRLGFVMKGERGEVAPSGIATGEFHDAGEKHQAE